MMLPLLREAVRLLEKAGCDTPALDAEVLLADLLACERYRLHSANNIFLTPEQKEAFCERVRRRSLHEPVAYIIGYREFWSLRIKVTPYVLIPRPETEKIVELGLAYAGKNKKGNIRFLDLCTGSGAVAAALLKELPRATGVASDISPEALKVAKENLSFAGERIRLLQSDLFENIEETFDLILSNPPYIPTAVYERLMPDVRLYEPKSALEGGVDGLAFVRKIRENGDCYLRRGGQLIMETGPDIETLWKS